MLDRQQQRRRGWSRWDRRRLCSFRTGQQHGDQQHGHRRDPVWLPFPGAHRQHHRQQQRRRRHRASARYGNGLAIQGNTFRDNAGNGIYLYTIESDGDNDVIAGNTFAGNNRGLFAKSINDVLRIDSNSFRNNTNNSVHDYDAQGGGIRLELAKATVVNNSFTENHARTYGGGLSVGNADWGTVLVQGNRFYSNTADWGGAIALDSAGVASVQGNLIAGNQARWGGGLGAGTGVQVTFQRNMVDGNQATRFGGGFECESCSAVLDANQLTDNSAGVEGGGAWLGGNTGGGTLAVPALTNNLIAGNSAPAGSGVMVSSRQVEMVHNTVAGNLGGAGVHVKVTSLPAGAVPDEHDPGEPHRRHSCGKRQRGPGGHIVGYGRSGQRQRSGAATWLPARSTCGAIPCSWLRFKATTISAPAPRPATGAWGALSPKT